MKLTHDNNDYSQDDSSYITRTEPKTEKEKLKEMSGKEKFQYILAYYKFHIIGVIVAILALVQVGQIMYRSTFENVFHITYLNSYSDTPIDETLITEDFASLQNLTEKEYMTTESAFLSLDDNHSEMTMAMTQKLSAQIATQAIDVMISDEEMFLYYAQLSGCANLETVLPSELYKKIEDRIVFAPGEDGVQYPCGIDLSGTPFAEASNLAQTPPYFFILVNSKHIDTCIDLLGYIFP